jgi:hypothetical protein
MQIPLRTLSNVDAYIRNREWNDVRLPACPMHPTGGCSFARHGSYERLSLSGLRIARWYCPEGHRTFSLIPDFVASRMPGLLDSIEEYRHGVFGQKPRGCRRHAARARRDVAECRPLVAASD